MQPTNSLSVTHLNEILVYVYTYIQCYELQYIIAVIIVFVTV